MKSRIVELDAMRGIAAVFVMTFHFAVMAGSGNPIFLVGVTGVDLFFLISGYVIFMTIRRVKTGYEFIVSRLLRLYPTYLVMMAVTIGVVYFFDGFKLPGMKTLLGNLTMMQPLFFVQYIDDSYWTLTVEMQFYVIMLILFLCKGLNRIELFGSLILASISIYYVITHNLFFDHIVYILPRSVFPILSHFQLFFAGILFYNIKVFGPSVRRYLLLVICFLFTLYLFDKSGRSHFFIDRFSYGMMISLYFLLFYLFIHDKLKFLNIGFLLFLGNISYGLYLIHQDAGKVIYKFLVGNSGVNPSLGIAVVIILVISFSAIVTYALEKPVNKIKKMLLIPGTKGSIQKVIP